MKHKQQEQQHKAKCNETLWKEKQRKRELYYWHFYRFLNSEMCFCDRFLLSCIAFVSSFTDCCCCCFCSFRCFLVDNVLNFITKRIRRLKLSPKISLEPFSNVSRSIQKLSNIRILFHLSQAFFFFCSPSVNNHHHPLRMNDLFANTTKKNKEQWMTKQNKDSAQNKAILPKIFIINSSIIKSIYILIYKCIYIHWYMCNKVLYTSIYENIEIIQFIL